MATRVWFALSLGSDDGGRDPNAWVRGTVVDVCEVVKDEIWCISVRPAQSGPLEVLYVLEATCEVVGRPTPQLHSPGEAVSQQPHDDSGIPLRADRSAYIADRLNPTSNPSPPSLLSNLKWTNHEEYDLGISKLWLKRVGTEGDVGAAKRRIAERYVLACVVANRLVRPLQTD